MRKLFLIILAGFLIFPSIVFAQSKLKLSAVNVQFWPEYDKADMLVINYIMLSPETSFPATVDLRIPANVESPLVVAVGLSPDEVTDQGIEYTTQLDGDWLVVSIEATGPAIQFEYYDPSLKKNGNSRSYLYEWTSDYNVQSFSVTVQQPFDATKLKTSPALQDDGIHSDQLQYYAAEIGALTGGKVFTFEISYEKRSDIFSASQLDIEPIDINEDTPGRISLNNYTPYLIGGIGVLIIVGGFAYYWRRTRRGGSKKSRRRRNIRVENETNVEESYCPQCGTRARAGDRFCRVCGGRLRHTEE